MSNVIQLFPKWEGFKAPTEKTSLPQLPRSKPKPARLKCSGLWYYPKLCVWKAQNVQIDPDTLEATSYGWWVMVRKIGNHVVFNDYGYSNSTRKHQAKVRRWLRTRGIETLCIESPRGLQHLDSAVLHYTLEIEALEKAIAKPHSQTRKNLERRDEIRELERRRAVVKELQTIDGGAK